MEVTTVVAPREVAKPPGSAGKAEPGAPNAFAALLGEACAAAETAPGAGTEAAVEAESVSEEAAMDAVDETPGDTPDAEGSPETVDAEVLAILLAQPVLVPAETVPATSTVTLDGEESDALQAVKVGEKGLSSMLPQVPKACSSPSPAPVNEAVAKANEALTGAQSAGQTLLNAVPPVENGEAVIVLDSPAKGAVKSGLETLLQEIVSKTATPQPESLREPGAQEPVKSVNPSIPVTTAQPVSGASGSESATAQFAFQTGSMERLDETVGASPVGRPTMQTLGDFTVRSVRYLVTNEETAMTVRLIPPSLGELRLHVTTSGDVVNVHIVSASPAVRDALNGDLAALREALNRGGIGIGQMSVSAGMTRDSGHGSTPYTQSGLDAAVAARRAQAVPAVAAVFPQRGAGHQGTLNLFM